MIEYQRISWKDDNRTLSTCGCPQKDCHVLETATLRGMGLPTETKKILCCILCGTQYISKEVRL